MFLSRQKMELEKVCFDQIYKPGEIEFFDQKLWQAGPLHAEGSAELLPHTDGEIRIRGHLEVLMEAECDLCLEVAQYPVSLDFDLFYEPVRADLAAEEVALDPEDVDVDFYQGDGLELEDVLREQVLLFLPMQRVCSENCQGICPVCGENRNRVNCNCSRKIPDDRWAALRRL